MSRDIRSFFQPKKVQKVVIEDDDDVIPESPDVQIKNKKKQPRKKRVLSDSDEEIFESKKKKIESECHTKSKNKSKTPQKPLKEVKVVDMFGSTPIKRTEPIVKKEKVKKNTETGIHSDEEFDKSLLELDDVDVFSKIDTNDSLNKSSKKHEKNIKTTEEKSPRKSKESLKNNEQNKTKRDIHVSKSSPKKSKLDNENKRKFAEFIEDKIVSNSSKQDVNTKKIKSDHNITEGTTNKMKKVLKNGGSSEVDNSDVVEKSFNESTHEITKTKKMNKSLNDSVLTDEERHERKIHSAALYQKYLNRTGPKNLGSKEMPEGLPDCLKDCAILLTGVLESFEREEITEAIVKYGGSIKNQISRKVTHVLAGEEPGPAKMAKAQELGIKIINEDEFLELIRSSSKKKPERNNVDIKKEKTPSGKINTDSKSSTKKSQEKHKSCSPKDNKIPKIKKEEDSRNLKKSDHREKIKSPIKNKSEIKVEKDILKSDVKIDNVLNDNKTGSCENNQSDPSMMWVDKYKPQNLKQIIGQHGEASNVKKLSNWLTKWYVNRKAKLPKPNPWAKNDDGGFYKAALLSGPPGVGKTTTVALVCKELGFDVVEFNASDTRSKNLIKEQITELLTTTSLSAYAKGDTGKQAVTKKHVLVMDEVDGMAGNEDRGGLQELIGLIKITSVPIICMCNDRNSQKMRSLVNYCYDLRFNRPRVDQIKSAMMSICFKEGVKVPPDVLTQLIVAANQDVRQTLHLLSMWAADPAHAHPDALRKDASKPKKDIKLGPWEAVRKVFSAEEHKTMSINDKSDLFFYDYSLAPLFVQENYLQVQPHCPKNEILDRVAKAADSISAGNLVDSRIRSNQAWSLLPIQAMFSSVIPGQAMSGHIVGQIQFPGWLGKNSRATKMHRLCQEIHAHTRLSTSGSKSSIFLDYCTHLRDAIVTPLIKDRADGIAKSMEVLESYHLLREDLDSLTELSLWPGQRNPMVLIDSKVKAAMTRTYNKSATALPYAPGSIKKGRTRNEADEEFEDEVDEEDEDSDPENDALIKKKKIEKPSSNKQKASSSKDKPSSSKDKPSSSKDKSSSSKDKSSSSKDKKGKKKE